MIFLFLCFVLAKNVAAFIMTLPGTFAQVFKYKALL